ARDPQARRARGAVPARLRSRARQCDLDRTRSARPGARREARRDRGARPAMKVAGSWRRTIELADDRRAVIVLDQQKLPREVSWVRLATLDDVARAIRAMTVRGAPLIGVTAAYGVAIALAEGRRLDDACTALAATRPAAIN